MNIWKIIQLFELWRKIWRHDWSLQLCTQLKQHVFFTIYGYIKNSQSDQLPDGSVGGALQRYRRGHGIESRLSLIFFQALISQLKKKFNFTFPFRTDRKWLNKTRRQKFAKVALGKLSGKVIRLSTIKFAKYYNLTSISDLVHGIRNQVLAVYLTNASRRVACCFQSLQRSKRGGWLLDASLNSF